MAYLELRSAKVAMEVDANSSRHERIRAEFEFSHADATKIADELGRLTLREGSELRTDFSEGWSLFWKLRAGESRFFVAHPEEDRWVGTLAVSESHLGAIRRNLASGVPGDLSVLEKTSRTSNLEIRIRFQA